LAVQVDREELEDDVVAVERVCRLLAEVCIQLLVLIANTRTDNPNNSTNNWLLSASAAFEHSHKPSVLERMEPPHSGPHPQGSLPAALLRDVARCVSYVVGKFCQARNIHAPERP
jgi:hypothetical protein